MPAIPRLKACDACASSKRRCDKQLPECQRCVDNDLDCTYPQRLKRRKKRTAGYYGIQESLNLPDHGITKVPGNGLEFGGWISADATDPQTSLAFSAGPYESLVAEYAANPAGQQILFDSNSPPEGLCPWFLEHETWMMLQCSHKPACAADDELEHYIAAMRGMLRSWVENGYNSFIHRRLYAKGMPDCLRDAFTTLATYTNHTPAVRELVLQIAEDRLSALTLQNLPTGSGADSILLQLAHVQALFVYEFIGLFDASVRLRAAAEKRLPILRRWVIQMWETVRHYRGEDILLNQRTLRWSPTEFDLEYETASEMWQLWSLTESARRTHLVVDSVANIYEIMTKKIVDCAGGVMFTARQGLWEADTAIKWFELCCAKPPLLVPSLQPGPLIAQYAAEEIDDFAKLCWTFLIGGDKIKCWIEKSKET